RKSSRSVIVEGTVGVVVHSGGHMPAQVAAVDEIPPVKADWPATWKSVRHHFGITGFGVNAVTKDADNVLIPEHDETESGQEELYFVHRGEVKATIDGEEQTVGEGG